MTEKKNLSKNCRMQTTNMTSNNTIFSVNRTICKNNCRNWNKTTKTCAIGRNNKTKTKEVNK